MLLPPKPPKSLPSLARKAEKPKGDRVLEQKVAYNEASVEALRADLRTLEDRFDELTLQLGVEA